MSWTSEAVRQRLIEAMRTERALPLSKWDRPSGFRSCMPDVVHNAAEAYGYYGDPGYDDGERKIERGKPGRPRPAAPSPDKIARWEEVCAWLLILDDRERICCTFRAAFPKRRLSGLAKRFEVTTRTIRRWDYEARFKIAAVLNEAEKKTLETCVRLAPIYPAKFA